MGFNFEQFLLNGFLKAVGRMDDYKIILNASGWYDKGVLSDESMAKIQAAIQAQYPEEEETTSEETTAETTTETTEETTTE